MKKRSGYMTWQSTAILDYIRGQEGKHTTAEDIAIHFTDSDRPIAQSTIYRQLDKLTEQGKIRKLTVDGSTGACFQYICENDMSQYHLKCDLCGLLYHLECDTLTELARHVYESHEFKINPLKTVFYGRCSGCLKKENLEKETPKL